MKTLTIKSILDMSDEHCVAAILGDPSLMPMIRAYIGQLEHDAKLDQAELATRARCITRALKAIEGYNAGPKTAIEAKRALTFIGHALERPF